MKRTLIAWVAVLALASGASAATIVVDTDKQIYDVGETILLTATLNVTGAEGAFLSASVNVEWNGALASPAGNASLPTITSFGGTLPWINGTGACLSDSCLLVDALSPITLTPVQPDAGVYIGTLELAVVSTLPGGGAGAQLGLDFQISSATPTIFGATPTLGDNAANAGVIPEPGTAALLGLGLLGLGIGGRRRR